MIAYNGFYQYNEKKQNNNAVLTDGAVLLSQSEDIYSCYLEKLKELGLDRVVLNEKTSRASNVASRTVVIDGVRYVNLCNEKDSEKKLSLTIDGIIPQYAKDLISGESINPSAFVLKPYQPMLLEIKNEDNEPVSAFSVSPGISDAVFSWKNNINTAKILTVYNKNEIVFTNSVPANDTSTDVSGLVAGTDYKAVLSYQDGREILNFKTQRNNNTKNLIKGWTLEYRGLNPYEFTEGEYKIVSDEAYDGQSSLKLQMYNPWQDMCYYQLWRNIRLTAGNTYKYTVRYKTKDYTSINSGKASFNISPNARNNETEVIIKDANGNILKPDGEWHEYSFEYTPSSTKNYALSIIVSFGGTLWLDGISVCRIKNGVEGENLIKSTSDTVGGDFEHEDFRTIPELPENVFGEFYGLNELKFNIPHNDDIDKINVYKEQGGEKIHIVSAKPDDVSVSARAYSDWKYYISAIDNNENESPMIAFSGKSLGNISKPFFLYGLNEAEYLTEGFLSAMGYAYEESELWLAVYNDGKLESIKSDSGIGWLKAESYVSGENIEKKKATVLFWNNVSPMNKKNELYPKTNNETEV